MRVFFLDLEVAAVTGLVPTAESRRHGGIFHRETALLPTHNESTGGTGTSLDGKQRVLLRSKCVWLSANMMLAPVTRLSHTHTHRDVTMEENTFFLAAWRAELAQRCVRSFVSAAASLALALTSVITRPHLPLKAEVDRPPLPHRNSSSSHICLLLVYLHRRAGGRRPGRL